MNLLSAMTDPDNLLTLFVAFPFSRLVHIWSAPLGYIARPYQLVRRRGRNARAV